MSKRAKQRPRSVSYTHLNPDFFASCSSLQKINLEEGASNTYSSEDGLLFNKTKTELVYCPQGRVGKYEFASTVVSVADKAFYKCKNLEEVVFNGWMQSIGDGAFEGCSCLLYTSKTSALRAAPGPGRVFVPTTVTA